MRVSRAVRERAETVRQRLAGAYPGTARTLCALRHDDPFQLLVATILSAQCTDERVNMVTPALFAEAPDPEALAGADPRRVEELIRSTGFFRAKTENLLGMARALVERFDGEVPSAMEDLVTLPGVGRKTANVVRSVDFGEPGLPVDTHVGRVSRRLRLTSNDDPVKVEQDLDALVPEGERGMFSLRLILHGRAVCTARSPKCSTCVLADVCPSAGVAAADPKRRSGGKASTAEKAPAARTQKSPTTRTKKAPAARTQKSPTTRTQKAPATRTKKAPATRTKKAPATRTKKASGKRTPAVAERSPGGVKRLRPG